MSEEDKSGGDGGQGRVLRADDGLYLTPRAKNGLVGTLSALLSALLTVLSMVVWEPPKAKVDTEGVSEATKKVVKEELEGWSERYVSKEDLGREVDKKLKDYVTTEKLKDKLTLAINEHSSVPHASTEALVLKETKDVGSRTSEQVLRAIGSDLVGIRRMLETQNSQLKEIEQRLRAVEQRAPP